MSIHLLSVGRKFSRRFFGFAMAATALMMSTASVYAQNTCYPLNGHYNEHIVTQNCNSPVGLCIAGDYDGVIQGSFSGAATSLTPSADTPTTGVLFFTSDSVIHAKVNGKEGDLIIKNAGAFQSVGDGNIVDVQIITGGTGGLVGASGAIRASGLFNPATGTGSSEYDGMICLP